MNSRLTLIFCVLFVLAFSTLPGYSQSSYTGPELTDEQKAVFSRYLPKSLAKFQQRLPVHVVVLGDSIANMLGYDKEDTYNWLKSFHGVFVNELCRQSAFDYIQEWERLTDRIAFWVDLDEAYVTYTNDYIESVWWILKNFWDKGLLY